MTIIYRPEIDGLRAVAVLSVILYHAGIDQLGGGYVGVDVFFVISGYLITTILLADIDQGSFSFRSFYARRIRRILPALYLVIVCSIPFAVVWLPPSQLKDYFESVFSAPIFLANHLFLSETGYFEADSQTKPLLHIWSLSVEEQFYLLFPVLLLWISRRRYGCLKWVVACLIFLSLALAEWLLRYHPESSFFTLPSRAWELAVGSMLALWNRDSNQFEAEKRWAEFLAFLGLCLIGMSVIGYDQTMAFPGVAALTPVLGAALVIRYAASGNRIGQFLSHRYLIGLGLLSYSAYLWHHPVFVFAKYRFGTDTNLLLLTPFIILLAWLSWRFLERPCRDRNQISGRVIFTMLFIVSVALLSMGAYGALKKGVLFDSIHIKQVADVEQRLRPNHGLGRECARTPLPDSCKTSTSPEIAIWGDSYGMHIVPAVLSSKSDASLMQITQSVCGPLLGVALTNSRYSVEWARECIRRNDKIFQELATIHSLRYVVLGSPFSGYVEDGAMVVTREGEKLEGQKVALSQAVLMIAELRRLGLVPVFVAPPPQSGQDIGQCLIRAAQLNLNASECNFLREEAERRQENVFKFLRDLEQYASVIWLDQAICEAGVCQASIGDTLIYRDSGHLSYEGSSLVGQKLNLYQLIQSAR